jgi:hypothetical protein
MKELHGRTYEEFTVSRAHTEDVRGLDNRNMDLWYRAPNRIHGFCRYAWMSGIRMTDESFPFEIHNSSLLSDFKIFIKIIKMISCVFFDIHHSFWNFDRLKLQSYIRDLESMCSGAHCERWNKEIKLWLSWLRFFCTNHYQRKYFWLFDGISLWFRSREIKDWYLAQQH